ncbi:MAG TPA: hypothetical protein VGC42_04645 [Kofleriaceae bacterium]
MTEATEPATSRASLVLTREVSCIRSLAWRCDLPIATDWSRLIAALIAGGLVELPAARGLHRLGSSTGDEILLVPISGRVQIRVHYTVPEHERRFAAERLFQRAVYAFGRFAGGAVT